LLWNPELKLPEGGLNTSEYHDSNCPFTNQDPIWQSRV
jgi:hypothetical protein